MESTVEIVGEAIRVLREEAQAILRCAEDLSQPARSQAFLKAIEISLNTLEGGGKIVLTGVGKSGKIAQKISATLCSTGSESVFLHPTEALHGDLGVLRSEDTVIALSYTGNTEEILKLLPILRNRGVSLIGVGGNPESQMAQKVDVWIDAPVETEACPLNAAPTTSTTLALALGDAIAVTLMKARKFNQERFAENHPGGSLGKKLRLRVKDLMKSGSELALVGPDAGMSEVVRIATEKKLGGVLVVEKASLLGLITDGDLRRALGQEAQFFGLKAREVMTARPIVVQEEAMASEALLLMENRSSQVSVLPVANESGEWSGLLRLHDLVRAF